MEEPALQLRICPACSAQMPGNAAFCPGCGRSMHEPVRTHAKVGALPENVAGAIAYFTFVPALVLLLIEPYRRSRFVRFHALQSLIFTFAAVAVAAALRLAGLLLILIPVAGPLLLLVVYGLFGLAVFMIWLVLVIKAAQGEEFELPFLGALAAQRADLG